MPLLPGAGFSLTLDQQFWLIAVPSLVGATVRIPYTFAVPLLRRPQLDHHLGPAAAPAGVRPRLGRHRAVVVVRPAARLRGPRRLRRRQLRLLDDEHLLLLPRGREGQGAGPQRRRRQPRHRPRPDGRAGRHRHRGRHAPRASRVDVHPAGDRSRPSWPGGAWTTSPAPRPTTAASRRPPATGTPGSSRSSTSAPSGRSSATRGPSPPCSRPSSPRRPRRSRSWVP